MLLLGSIHISILEAILKFQDIVPDHLIYSEKPQYIG